MEDELLARFDPLHGVDRSGNVLQLAGDHRAVDAADTPGIVPEDAERDLKVTPNSLREILEIGDCGSGDCGTQPGRILECPSTGRHFAAIEPERFARLIPGVRQLLPPVTMTDLPFKDADMRFSLGATLSGGLTG
jgi:hypothetical protein